MPIVGAEYRQDVAIGAKNDRGADCPLGDVDAMQTGGCGFLAAEMEHHATVALADQEAVDDGQIDVVRTDRALAGAHFSMSGPESASGHVHLPACSGWVFYSTGLIPRVFAGAWGIGPAAGANTPWISPVAPARRRALPSAVAWPPGRARAGAVADGRGGKASR